MNDFIRKYRFNIVWMVGLSFLLFFFLPGEEERYSRWELKEIRHAVQVITICAIALLSLISIIIIIKHQKKLSSFFSAVAAVAFWSWAGYLFLYPVILSGTFFLNKLMKEELPGEVYFASVFSSKLIALRNDRTDLLSMETLDEQAANKELATGDTVIIVFRKGLLGFDFDPKIKEIRRSKQFDGNAAAENDGVK